MRFLPYWPRSINKTILPIIGASFALCYGAGCSSVHNPFGPEIGSGGAESDGNSSGGNSANSGGHSGDVASGGLGSGGDGALGSGGGVASGGSDNAAGGSDTASGGASSEDPINARDLVDALGFGANIGNTLENTSMWETGWGQPLITQTFINGLASRGIKTVRVPVAWDTYANNGVIDAEKTQRVKEVVQWIEAAGMYAIVNIHWDGGWINNEHGTPAYKLTDEIRTKFENYWKQIGTALGDIGHHLILEGLNEEGSWTLEGTRDGTPDIAPLNEMNQLFVSTVRGLGGYNASRALLIAGFNTDVGKTCVPAFTAPNDPSGEGKLFLSIHFYDPYTFTLMEDVADWGSPVTTWGTEAEKSALTSLFDKMKSCSDDKKLPIILGEFAVTRGTNFIRENASRAAWLTAVAEASAERGIVPVLWDTGSEISRVDGAFSAEFQTAFDSFD